MRLYVAAAAAPPAAVAPLQRGAPPPAPPAAPLARGGGREDLGQPLLQLGRVRARLGQVAAQRLGLLNARPYPRLARGGGGAQLQRLVLELSRGRPRFCSLGRSAERLAGGCVEGTNTSKPETRPEPKPLKRLTFCM